MEKITINPGTVEVSGNIISDQHGYVEDIMDFESHKCTLSLNSSMSKGWKDFNVYSFQMTMNTSLTNQFNEAIQYCKPTSTSSLFVCEHLDSSFDNTENYLEIIHFMNGYFLKIKEDYVASGVDVTRPFFLLIHQNNVGVELSSSVSKIRFTSNYTAKNTIEAINVGFVFFDKDGLLIENQEGENIVNEATGPTGRLDISTTEIPSNAKYVSVEFSFPDGLQSGDYISLQLNCLLFDSDYSGFIKN